MFGLSFTHILVLLVLALIFIGPEQLPEVARTIARFINELKRTTNGMAEQMKQASVKESIHKPEGHSPESVPVVESLAKDTDKPQDG